MTQSLEEEEEEDEVEEGQELDDVGLPGAEEVTRSLDKRSSDLP